MTAVKLESSHIPATVLSTSYLLSHSIFLMALEDRANLVFVYTWENWS